LFAYPADSPFTQNIAAAVMHITEFRYAVTTRIGLVSKSPSKEYSGTIDPTMAKLDRVEGEIRDLGMVGLEFV
jgi:hypothetical protein